MRIPITLFWLAIGIVANAQPVLLSLGNTNISYLSVVSPTNLVAITNAAAQGLITFRTLITPVNFSDLGFASTNEITSATLSDPLLAYKIRLDALRSYDTN